MRSRSRFRPALLAGALSLVAHSASAQQFEGVIVAKMKGDGAAAAVTYSIKGEKIRMDMGSESGIQAATIVDRAAKKMYLLMPQQQMYMERALDVDAAAVAAEPRSRTAHFSWTGTSQTIAGMHCDDAVLKDEDGTQLNFCIAKGLAFFGGNTGPMGVMGGTAGRGASRGTWQSQVQGGFPLRVQRVGDAEPLLEVTSVQKRALSDDLFTAPPGWRKIAMPTVGRP
jgi:hypothetical protein